jgi:hypothetical protein
VICVRNLDVYSGSFIKLPSALQVAPCSFEVTCKAPGQRSVGQSHPLELVISMCRENRKNARVDVLRRLWVAAAEENGAALESDLGSKQSGISDLLGFFYQAQGIPVPPGQH